MTTKALQTNLIVSVIILFIVYSMDPLLKEKIMKYSMDLTKLMHKSSEFLFYWFWLYHKLLYFAIPVFYHLSIFFMKDKSSAILFLSFGAIEIMTTNLLKLAYHDTRPCFEDEEISLIHCSCTFGKPSGHSSSSFVFYSMVYYLLFWDRENASKKGKVFGFIGLFIIVLNVGLSRIYFGAHFINQVLMGWSLGYVILSVFLLLKSNRVMQRIVESPLDSKDRDGTLINYFIIALGTLEFLVMLLWIAVRNMFEDNPYHPYMKSSNCYETCFKNKKYFSDPSLFSSSFYLGVLYFLLAMKAYNAPLYIKNSNYYNVTLYPFKNLIKRILVVLIVCIPLGCAFIFKAFNTLFGWFLMNSALLVYMVFFFILYKRLLIAFRVFEKGDFFNVNLIKGIKLDDTDDSEANL